MGFTFSLGGFVADQMRYALEFVECSISVIELLYSIIINKYTQQSSSK